MSKKIFISIATYNEKENIEKLIQDIFGVGYDNLSIIIIDDNSPDGTSDIVKRLQSEFTNLYLIQRSGKLGYGSAHIAGFKLAMEKGSEIIISMDADFSHDPKKIPELVTAMDNGSDVVIGSRRVAGGKVVGWGLWRKFCSAGAMLSSQVILGIKTKDLTSGFRAYDVKVFNKVNLDSIKSNGYSFLEELIYLVEKNKFTVKEVPIVFHDRQLGNSKLSKKEIVKFFITIFKIKFGKK
ncbi:polyprenol monophosphomannose synthase [Candidatus Falkowbacteria bacterium]|uniref:Dolichyl-phosphate beta-D-mannosyltransferase n=1 Tax=Candidatus Buchananbacteria bacterium CG10_big_fil_rev_8_21_14_0_10_33_19 TaxID=1974525 RepID=A0A2H0W382_9BACT|nr:polyprenol monophosphomannose synthase [Candidatus Falkowbacteria bacterium]PIS05823.1 MAG: dolichyl-phosphate beta-D-mannosyltransferase [Candidatus Buchananbacteria bacterium CG10_big_fil_rev_8_21_14_0_10_33_19]